MAKATSAFRMKKYLKWLFQREIDPQQRSEMRRLVVQAQLASEVRVKEKKSRNQPDLETT